MENLLETLQSLGYTKDEIKRSMTDMYYKIKNDELKKINFTLKQIA